MFSQARTDLAEKGFTIIPDFFTDEVLHAFTEAIEQASAISPNFRRTTDLFAIRNLLQEVPILPELLWTIPFNRLLDTVVGYGYDCVKGIYFDKPAQSN
ncbi:hypothetical protein IC229_15510 [Spirosoma sp. BT702]|uniref:Phytanoyl-CoA dioxygenase n=1 Tax=Spirosoma profusum TaxID=2771354 RepID=A0A927AU23_9BACT|nr:hypothetical protein [Spirosoma profusum]MBD2702057.1 hypothetical protein [Spirosoma profusum]